MSAYDPIFLHPAWYVHKDIYAKYGLYLIQYNISSDYEYFLRLVNNKVVIEIINEVLALFRVDGASSTLSGTIEAFQIDKSYFGLVEATCRFMVRLFKKVRLFILKIFIGSSKAHRIRCYLKKIKSSIQDH